MNSWFGVTPEPVAKLVKVIGRFIIANKRSSKIAQHIGKVPTEKTVLIDCFAGVGGNVIAFAQSSRWDRIYAIERDSKVLACAKRNAEIYGVQDRISWCEGDCFDLLESTFAELGDSAVIFASPPWGGEYRLHLPGMQRP